MRTESFVGTLKATPPGVLFGTWLAGISINEWAAFAGLLYTVMLIGQKCYHWAQAWRAKKRPVLK